MNGKLSAIAIIGATGLCSLALLSARPVSAQGQTSTWDGVYTAQQAKKGEADYAQNCASCHGNQLEGGEMAPPLTGAAFTANWNGESLGTLEERIHISMPANNPGSLDRQVVADVVAYMLEMNKFPAGKTPLAANPDMVKDLKFVVEKPTK
jgi:mono/diheme cytochrome c family protein